MWANWSGVIGDNSRLLSKFKQARHAREEGLMSAKSIQVGDKVFVYKSGPHYGRRHVVIAVHGPWITAKLELSGDTVKVHDSEVEAAT